MQNQVLIALAKGLKADVVKAASGSLQAGKYAVDAIVRVSGTITKGEDYTQVITMAVPLEDMLAVALSKLNGITMESIIEEAIASPAEKFAEAKAKAKAALAAYKREVGTEVCAGRVTTKVSIEEVTVETFTAVQTASKTPVAPVSVAPVSVNAG